MYALRHRQNLHWVVTRDPIFTYSPDWDKAEKFDTREAARAAVPEEMQHAHEVGRLPTRSRVYEQPQEG